MNLVGFEVINESFSYARPGQSPRPLSVHIEDPRRRSDGLWECRVEIPGHWEAIQISGASPIQATCLAFRFVRECLERLNNNGEVSYTSGGAVQMDELFGLVGASTDAIRL